MPAFPHVSAKWRVAKPGPGYREKHRRRSARPIGDYALSTGNLTIKPSRGCTFRQHSVAYHAEKKEAYERLSTEIERIVSASAKH
jgi:hypothetical protein